MRRLLPLVAAAVLAAGCSFLVPGTNIRVGTPYSQVPSFTVELHGDRYLYSNANLQISYPATWGNGTDFLPGIGDLHSLVSLDIGKGTEASIYFDDGPAIVSLKQAYQEGRDGVRSVLSTFVDGVAAVRVERTDPATADDAATDAPKHQPEQQLLVAAIYNGREIDLKLVTRPPLKGDLGVYQAVFEDMLSNWRWHRATPTPAAVATATPSATTTAPSISPTPAASASR